MVPRRLASALAAVLGLLPAASGHALSLKNLTGRVSVKTCVQKPLALWGQKSETSRVVHLDLATLGDKVFLDGTVRDPVYREGQGTVTKSGRTLLDVPVLKATFDHSAEARAALGDQANTLRSAEATLKVTFHDNGEVHLRHVAVVRTIPGGALPELGRSARFDRRIRNVNTLMTRVETTVTEGVLREATPTRTFSIH